MNKFFKWCLLLVLIIAFNACSSDSKDLPEAMEQKIKSIETFNEVVLKNPTDEAVVEKALDTHIADLNEVFQVFINSKILEMKPEQQKEIVERLLPIVKKHSDKKLVSVYLLAQTNATKLSLTNKKIEIKLQTVSELNNKIEEKFVEIMKSLQETSKDEKSQDTLKLFGGKYSDARQTLENFVNTANDYAETLEKAKTPQEVVTGMNLFADRIEKLKPEMDAMNEKYPELKELGTNPPEELKDMPEKMKSALTRLSKALVYIVPFIKDPEVEKGMKRVEKALNFFSGKNESNNEKYADAREALEGFVDAANEYADALESATSASDIVFAMNRFADKMSEVKPKMDAMNQKYPELKNLGTNPPEELKDLPEKMKAAIERLSGCMVRCISPYINDPEVQKASKRVQDAM